MKILSFILTLSILASLTACSSTAQKLQYRNDALLGRTVYATDDAIKAKRYDLAKTYSEQSTRLIAPPEEKNRVKVQPFTKKTNQSTEKFDDRSPAQPKATESEPTETAVVVLPEEDKGAIVVVDKSAELKAVLDERDAFKKAYENEQLEKANVKVTVNKLVSDKQKFLEDQARHDAEDTIWHRIKSVFGWTSLGGIVVLLGALALMIFNPALGVIVFKVIFNIFTYAGKAIAWVFTGLLTAFNGWFSKKPGA